LFSQPEQLQGDIPCPLSAKAQSNAAFSEESHFVGARSLSEVRSSEWENKCTRIDCAQLCLRGDSRLELHAVTNIWLRVIAPYLIHNGTAGRRSKQTIGVSQTASEAIGTFNPASDAYAIRRLSCRIQTLRFLTQLATQTLPARVALTSCINLNPPSHPEHHRFAFAPEYAVPSVLVTYSRAQIVRLNHRLPLVTHWIAAWLHARVQFFGGLDVYRKIPEVASGIISLAHKHDFRILHDEAIHRLSEAGHIRHYSKDNLS
ncbi:uncharacterized protein LAESUDRAFT_749522, partial [Laetiporus sulphureus 93-53]